MTRVVGIGGKLASGKDAISDHLVEKHGWVKFGMSDALADALYTLDPWIPEESKKTWHLDWIPLRSPKKLRRWLRYPYISKYSVTYWTKYSGLFHTIGYVKAKENEEVRRLLQVLGTEVGRKQLSDGALWTDIMERKVREAVAAGAPGVIITGIRFPNEVDMLENLDAEGWWVSRPSLKNTTSTATHASENSVSEVDFDLCIVNDGTLPNLYDKVDRLVT